MPKSLHEILLARASRIDSDAEHLVRVTALIGRAVGHDLLASASRLDEARLAVAIGQAVDSGLLVADSAREEYAFRHVLTQEAVGERILPAERRRLHEAIAAALARDPTVTQSASRAAEWAAHVLASGDRDAAFVASLRAGRLAALVYAYAAAWRQYSRVVELLGTVDADAFGEPATVVLAEAAEAARWGGDLAAAVSLSERAVEGCPASVETAEITERAGRYLVEAGRLDDAETHYLRAQSMADDLDDVALNARIAASWSRLLMQTGRYQQAIPAARVALELAAEADTPLEAGRAHTALGMSLVLLGTVDDGVHHVRAGHELVHAHGDLDDRRRADSNLSYALLIAGMTREACDVSVSGLQTMRRYGLAAAGGGALTSNTIVLLRMSGRWADAEELSDEAESQGLADGLALRIALSRTELEIARGEYERARGHLDRAWQLAGPQASAEILADLHLAEANIALAHDDPQAAATAVDRAAEMLDDGTPRLSARTCVVGLRVEAELAEQDAPGSQRRHRHRTRRAVPRAPRSSPLRNSVARGARLRRDRRRRVRACAAPQRTRHLAHRRRAVEHAGTPARTRLQLAASGRGGTLAASRCRGSHQPAPCARGGRRARRRNPLSPRPNRWPSSDASRSTVLQKPAWSRSGTARTSPTCGSPHASGRCSPNSPPG